MGSSSGETDLSDINGMTKIVYEAGGVNDFLPKSSIFQDRIGFENGAKVGDRYAFSVTLQLPQGVTYGGSSGARRTLKQPRPQLVKQALVIPFEFNLREEETLVALSRAATEGKGSFASLTGHTYKNMKTSASNRFEISIIHGQRGLGIVESVEDLTGNVAWIVLTAASFAPGMWWALIGATLDSMTSTTVNNGSGPIIVTGVDVANHRIKVTFTGTLASECTAADVLYFEGAYASAVHLEMPGLLAQVANTSGTSLELSAGTYPNWAGNTYDVAGNISSDVVEYMAGLIRNRGASGMIGAYVSNKGFGPLMAELKSLRVIDSSYSPEKGKTGHKGIALYSPDFGEIEINIHPFFKDSELLLIDTADCARVGSADLDFGVPGISVTELPKWERVANTNVAEVQLFSDQSVCCKAPAQAILGTGITFT